MLGILVAGGAVERRSFVVKEQKFIRPIRCGKCGGNAHLTRRSPDPCTRATDKTGIRGTALAHLCQGLCALVVPLGEARQALLVGLG